MGKASVISRDDRKVMFHIIFQAVLISSLCIQFSLCYKIRSQFSLCYKIRSHCTFQNPVWLACQKNTTHIETIKKKIKKKLSESRFSWPSSRVLPALFLFECVTSDVGEQSDFYLFSRFDCTSLTTTTYLIETYAKRV